MASLVAGSELAGLELLLPTPGAVPRAPRWRSAFCGVPFLRAHGWRRAAVAFCEHLRGLHLPAALVTSRTPWSFLSSDDFPPPCLSSPSWIRPRGGSTSGCDHTGQFLLICVDSEPSLDSFYKRIIKLNPPSSSFPLLS